MSNRNLPIYQLTPLSIRNMIAAIDNNGRQFVGAPLRIGSHPLQLMSIEDYLPAGKHHVSQSKGVKKTSKVVNIYHLKNDTWLYSTPKYKIRKINGTTQRSVDDLPSVYPSNAIAVYQITVSWEDSIHLEGLNLDIVKYVP